jgi:hypothetical protein
LQYFTSLKRCWNFSTTLAITFQICQSVMNFTILERGPVCRNTST